MSKELTRKSKFGGYKVGSIFKRGRTFYIKINKGASPFSWAVSLRTGRLACFAQDDLIIPQYPWDVIPFRKYSAKENQ